MSGQDKVSIIIPSYNYGRYLRECLESVCAQIYQNWEAIIVDDGSTDETQHLASSIVSLDPTRIQYYRTSNKGVSHARNYAIDKSSGEFILPLDADDILNPEALCEFVKYIKKDEKAGFAYCALQNMNSLPGENSSWLPGLFSRKQITRDNPASCTSIWRKALWNCGVRYRDFIFEDWDLWLQIVARGYRGTYIPRTLFKYRIHPHGRHTTNRNRYVPAWIEIADGNPALFQESIRSWAGNALRNAPQCFKKPSVVFIASGLKDNGLPLSEAQLTLLRSFIQDEYFVVVLGSSPQLPSEPGLTPLKVGPDNLDAQITDQLARLGSELIVFNEAGPSISRRIKGLNNHVLTVNCLSGFDPFSDISLEIGADKSVLKGDNLFFSEVKSDLNNDMLLTEIKKVSDRIFKTKKDSSNQKYAQLISLAENCLPGKIKLEENDEKFPGLSLVIYHDGADRISLKYLEACLESVNSQKVYKYSECLVVSSVSEFKSELEALTAQYGACLIEGDSAYSSRAHHLNLAVQQSSYEWLMFIDYDVVLKEDLFLVWHAYRGRMGKNAVYSLRKRKSVEYVKDLSGSKLIEGFRRITRLGEETEISCQIMHRNLYADLKGYNRSYIGYGMEAADFNLRAAARENKIVWLNDEFNFCLWSLRKQAKKQIEFNHKLFSNIKNDPSLEIYIEPDIHLLNLKNSAFDAASPVLQELIKSSENKDGLQILNAWAEHLIINLEHECAIDTLLDIITIDPKNFPALLGLARAYVAVGDVAKAGHYALLAFEAEPQDTTAAAILAHLESYLN